MGTETNRANHQNGGPSCNDFNSYYMDEDFFDASFHDTVDEIEHRESDQIKRYATSSPNKSRRSREMANYEHTPTQLNIPLVDEKRRYDEDRFHGKVWTGKSHLGDFTTGHFNADYYSDDQRSVFPDLYSDYYGKFYRGNYQANAYHHNYTVGLLSKGEKPKRLIGFNIPEPWRVREGK
jgi:hypothetical protein